MAEPIKIAERRLFVRIERFDVDLARQELKPSADRRNVVQLDRVREQREQTKQKSREA
jgi:hypothetical protein